MLATNQYAGHLGYHESLFSLDQWFATPVIDFLEALEADYQDGKVPTTTDNDKELNLLE